MSRSLRFGSRIAGISLLIFIPLSVIYGQQRCGTEAYRNLLRQKNEMVEPDDQFEQWLKSKITEPGAHQEAFRQKAEPYRVQVVVHIIHNGEAPGAGTNLSDAQVLSQIDVLNKDFNRLNEDASNTPSEFQSYAGSMSIEFVLAEFDPNGLPTTGINRVQGTKSNWTIEDNSELKSLSYWPAENYINIWVCNITDYFGFTQFPTSSLPGLASSAKDRLTDGILISYLVFGSSDYGAFNLHPDYNKGRTTTHEMGHFFGLRHIWGDDDECGATDYVDDTPDQSVATLGCPVHPQPDCPLEVPANKMFQNYLDFTDDVCMNLFTHGQVIRMKTVLENSPRRASLLIPLSGNPREGRFPKLFSPNGDGVNDFWLWENSLDYIGCKLTIFNRFGKPVYEMISYDGSWNGRTKEGFQLEEEAYYFIIRCDGQKEITGGVRIVR
jgi:gliding motility-associated-like protein